MSTFRIGLFGNMNNNFYVLGRFLQDKGYHVTLMLNEGELDQFRPENDTLQPTSFPIVETHLKNAPTKFLHTDPAYARQLTANFDYLIVCGSAPAYFHRAGIVPDLFIPYGNDIHYMPVIGLHKNDGLKKNIKRWYYSYHQRKGIQSIPNILIDYTNAEMEAIFAHLLKKGQQRFFCNPPLLYTPDFNPESIRKYYPESTLYPAFKAIRDRSDLMVFSQIRQIWKPERRLQYNYATNGNNKLIEGFARWAKENPACRASLVLFEYGGSVDDSKALIRQLGIESMVHWFPLSPRKEVMVGISLSDIGVGELDSSYFSYGSIHEFMAMGKPIIHYREDALYRTWYPDMYPMYSANSSELVYQRLNEWKSSPATFAETGQQAHNWFVRHAIEEPLERITGLLEQKKHQVSARLTGTALPDLITLCYHGVVEHILHPRLERNFHTLETFQQQIKLLLKKGYTFIDGREVLNQLRQPGHRNKKLIHLTFDDGYQNNLQVIDFLSRLSIPATIFLSTGLIGGRHSIWTVDLSLLILEGSLHEVRFNNKTYDLSDKTKRESAFNEIRFKLKASNAAERISGFNEVVAQFPAGESERLLECFPSFRLLNWQEVVQATSPLIQFQSHGHLHELFHHNQDLETLQQEINTSAQSLADHLGKRPFLYGYPNGNFDARAIPLLKAAGYEAAFILDRKSDSTHGDPYCLPRISPPRDPKKLLALIRQQEQNHVRLPL